MIGVLPQQLRKSFVKFRFFERLTKLARYRRIKKPVRFRPDPLQVRCRWARALTLLLFIAGKYLIDQAVLFGLEGAEPLVTIRIFFDGLFGLAGMVSQDLVQFIA